MYLLYEKLFFARKAGFVDIPTFNKMMKVDKKTLEKFLNKNKEKK